MPSMKAIVTGHSRGLGQAIAAELLGRGIPVLGLARGHCDELAGAFPGLLQQAAVDLAEPRLLQAWLAGGALAAWLGESGQILLVNNAGTVQPVGALELQDAGTVADAVNINIAAPLMLSAAVAQARQGAACRILHVSSGAGRSAYPGWSVYCATKAALDHHARAVALDGSPGLRICSLAPGVIDTAMQAEIRATPAAQFPLRQRFVDMQREGQLSTPAGCAVQLVDYLLAAGFGNKPVDDLRG